MLKQEGTLDVNLIQSTHQTHYTKKRLNDVFKAPQQAKSKIWIISGILTLHFFWLQLIYNIALISADSVTDTYSFSSPILFSIIVYHRILTTVRCAMQQHPGVYPSHIDQFASANPRLPIQPSQPPPPQQPQVCSLRECVSVLQISSLFCYFRFHI